MITLLFGYANEKLLVTIKGNNVTFASSSFGAVVSDISGLKLDYNGVCRQFPDLETNEKWREEAIKRFRTKIKSFKKENDIVAYIIEELKPHGYVPEQMQREGFRPTKIKWTYGKD